MKENKKEKKFIDLPEYPGGKEAFQSFLKKNLQYPNEAKEKGIEGSVYVKFRVDGLGKVVHAEVTHPLGFGCDEEALRVVRLLKYGKAKNRGVRVTATIRTKINFKLAQPPAIQYNYVVEKKKEEKKSVQKASATGVTYTYTIKY